MISTEMSMIRVKDPERAALAANIEAFLSAGGTIMEAAISASAEQKPLSERKQTPNFQRPAVKVAADDQSARIRKMAKSMNRQEICDLEGITLGMLRGIGRRYGIEFTAGPKKAFAPNKATPEIEALLVIRVKDCMAKGINRSQCAKALCISTTLLGRLIKDYAIDYPKMKPAFR